MQRLRQFMNTLNNNDTVKEYYLCKTKEALKSNAGKTYYSLRLFDKTGGMPAKIWELNKNTIITEFLEGDVVQVEGVVLDYKGELQMKVIKVRKAKEGEYAIEDFIPTTEKDISQMYQQLTALIDSVKDEHIKLLLKNIYVNNKEQAEIIRTHSAAKGMHHAYMGGLLEHTLSVTEICLFMADRYKHLNRDLLIAGGLLHDIGKIQELTPMPSNTFTDDGQLLGHIIIGVGMVTEEVKKIPNFSHELASIIKHLIVSHHGELEFGSPKLPYISEAMCLHFADNMDAKLKTFDEVLDADNTPGPWAGYNKMLNRYVRTSEYE